MSKRLNSLLEMAVVISGLAGAPFVVVASLAPVAAAAHAEQAPVAVAQDIDAPGPSAADLRY
jgi:hypothetical protein